MKKLISLLVISGLLIIFDVGKGLTRSPLEQFQSNQVIERGFTLEGLDFGLYASLLFGGAFYYFLFQTIKCTDDVILMNKKSEVKRR
jgi:hypothetical protein